jgi:hypothetical protein
MVLISASLRTKINVSKVSTFSAWEMISDMARRGWPSLHHMVHKPLSRGFIQLHSSWHVSILVISCPQWSLNWVLSLCRTLVSLKINDRELVYWGSKKDKDKISLLQRQVQSQYNVQKSNSLLMDYQCDGDLPVVCLHLSALGREHGVCSRGDIQSSWVFTTKGSFLIFI